jgi:hypothetical protein
LKGLFLGNLAWCRENFPTENGWTDEQLGTWLMQRCAREGLFDPEAPVRGPGIWRNGADDLIVHCGDILLDPKTGVETSAGTRIGGALYPAAPPIARPASTPASIDEGEQLKRAIELWRFADPLAAELLLGWIGAAMLGGAPDWRMHVLVRGSRGRGKSWLADLVAGVLGGGAHPMQNDYTEAGLRQALTGGARALVLDEAEATGRNSRIRQVIELLRRMSGGAGARAVRGTTSGKALNYQITGPVYLSAILPPPLQPQDSSRIVEIDLADLTDDVAYASEATRRNAVDDAMLRRERAQEAIRWAARESAGLRARAIGAWSLFNDCFGAYHAAVLSTGCDMRQADHFATLLAGRDILIHEGPPDADFAALEVDRFANWIKGLRVEEESNEGELCLDHLYHSQIDPVLGRERLLVGEIVLRALEPSGVTERDALRRIGVRIEDWQTPYKAWLCVANKHAGLNRIFAGTRWENGGWKTALRYLDGATHWPQSLRFYGRPTRATALPAVWLPTADTPTADEVERAEDLRALEKTDMQ